LFPFVLASHCSRSPKPTNIIMLSQGFAGRVRAPSLRLLSGRFNAAGLNHADFKVPGHCRRLGGSVGVEGKCTRVQMQWGRAFSGANGAPASQKVVNEASVQEGMSSGEKLYRAGGVLIGITFGLTLVGAVDFLFDFPKPLEIMWDRCQECPLVKEEFGEELTKSLFWDGGITENTASVTLPFSGTKESGSVYGRFLKNLDGEWDPVIIIARTKNKTINVFEKS